MRTALIDADIIVFRAASTRGANIDWEAPGFEAPEAPCTLDEAVDAAQLLIADWVKGARCDKVILCFSDPAPRSSFRYSIFGAYKSNRKVDATTGLSAKPPTYWPLVAALQQDYECLTLPRLEADDVMGIYASRAPDEFVIVSMDKDMLTIPARVFLPHKMQRPALISQFAAFVSWMTQTLQGDPTDGYPGCPGVGPKGAAALIERGAGDVAHIWEAVAAKYIEKGRTIEDAITNARCARILRATDFNPVTGELRLWHPTSPVWIHPTKLPV